MSGGEADSPRHLHYPFGSLCLCAFVVICSPACSLISLRTQDIPPEIRVAFRGNKAFDDRTLLSALTPYIPDFKQPAIPESKADDAAYEVALYYRERGFPFVEVEYQVSPGRRGQTLLLLIREGARVRLKDVHFDGVFAFSEPEILPLFLGGAHEDTALQAPMGLATLAGSETWYVERDVEAAARSVLALYQDQGYLDAQLLGIDTRYNAERTEASTLLRFQEGSRYTVDSLELFGNLEGLRGDALAATGLATGDPYTPWRASEARARVLDMYAQRGFLFAKVELEEERRGTLLRLRFQVDAGERRRLRQIVVRGLSKTRPWAAVNIMDLDQGRVMNREALRRAYRRLAGSGLFRGIDLTPQEVRDTPDQVDLGVEVTERPSVELGFLGGYGSYERLRGGLEFTEQNLLGLGRAATVSGRLSEVGWRFRAGLMDRYFLGTDLQESFSGYLLRRDDVSFLREERGAESILGWDLIGKLRMDVTYRFSVTDATQVKNVGEVVKDADPVFSSKGLRTSAISLGGRLDLRDRPTDPTRGLLLYLRAESAHDLLGSEVEFTRITAGSSLILPVIPWVSLATGARGGIIRPRGETALIPIQDRFFVGGESTVRSFEEGKLGPLNSAGEPQGGEAFAVLNLEARLAVRDGWGLVMFGDAGKLEQNWSNFNFADMEYAVGGGLRYRTPMGPLRFDYGMNPSRDKGQRSSLWFFSVGHPF